MNFDDYERRARSDYEAFAKTVANILEAAIRADPAYRLQQIQHRGKDPTSLNNKLTKFGASDSDRIEDRVKDLAGCRIIFYTNADVNRFRSSDILRSNFIIDWDRTKIHHPVPGTETAGRFFISDNIVVTLNDQRASAAEYARFREMRCEIQIQTTLNHAWSEMEHDFYKIKPAAGFGKSFLQDIQKRFDKVMREMLIPAGYEFQKIVDDYSRLASGRELFDRGALRILAECTDNNERYELLERFKAHVLPHLDDPAGTHAEIQHALIAAVQAARASTTISITTPWGELEGRSAKDVLELAADVLDQLRYVSLEAVETTLDALCILYPGATSEEERKRILGSVKLLAAHNYHVWRTGGPIVQEILVRRIRSWDTATLESLRPVVLSVLEEILRPEASGKSATYKTMTLTTAEVTASETLAGVRSGSLDLLEELFRSASNDVERRGVKQALLGATRLPQGGSAQSSLLLNILENSARVARFFSSMADALSHELAQNLEERFLWLYRHTRVPADAPPEDAPIADARRIFIEAVFEFRDRINSNRDFVVYKTLVGFESVFAPEWEGEPLDHASRNGYRNERISDLVAEVNGGNADVWLGILQRCAGTRSNDLATFPSFGHFLEELARTKPEIVESYLDRLGDDLSNFLPAMLCGIEGTARWPAAKSRIDKWVSGRRYLSQVLLHQRFTTKIDVRLVQRVLRPAIEDGNDRAVTIVAEICVARSDAVSHEEIGALFTSAVSYLKSKDNTAWADATWAYIDGSSLIESLTPEQIDLVLSALVPRESVDTPTEYWLTSIAKKFPEKVVDFFGARLRFESIEDVVGRYEAVPYSLTDLGEHLASAAPYLLARCEAWHRENPELFEFRGGRLFTVAFPQLTSPLEDLLKQLLLSGRNGVTGFVADLLRGYRGMPETHELCKLIVHEVAEGDRALAAIEFALMSTSVVSGEFGMREAYQRKKAEIQPWLADPRQRVRTFAEAHDRMLDRMIADEQRRSEEDIEARKRQYG